MNRIIDTQFWASGSILSETPYIDNLVDGTQRCWHPSGQLSGEYQMMQGKHHGVSREWYVNGNMRIYEMYSHNLKHGLICRWLANCELQTLRLYHQDQLVIDYIQSPELKPNTLDDWLYVFFEYGISIDTEIIMML